MDVNEVCTAFEMALELELEGFSFYTKAAHRTQNPQGKEMFLFLAGEEKAHYERVEELYERKFHQQYCTYKNRSQTPEDIESGVFESQVAGGSLDEKADALDALNIAINAEENSIEVYQKLMDASDDAETKRFFANLIKEEEKHLVILEAEIEPVTETGEFNDFKMVSS